MSFKISFTNIVVDSVKIEDIHIANNTSTIPVFFVAGNSTNNLRPSLVFTTPPLARLGNFGRFTWLIAGGPFPSGTQVKLSRSGHSDINVHDSLIKVDPTGRALRATFDFNRPATGNWDLVVTIPGDTVMTVPDGVVLDSFRTAGITPTSGGNTRILPVTIHGNYLPDDCEIKLTRASYPDIHIKRTLKEVPAAIRGTAFMPSAEVDLRGHDTGSRALEVHVKGQLLYQWPNAFRVLRYPSSFYTDPVLYRTFPNTASNAGRTSITVYGAGFTPQTEFKLTAPGLPDIIIPDSLISVSTNNQVMNVAMDLNQQDTGYRNIVVTIPGDTTMTLYRAFKIIAPAIKGYVPHTGGNTAPVTLRITGSGIPEEAQVRLTRQGQPDIVAPDSLTTVSQNGQLIHAVVDLNGKDPGYYDIVISNATRQLHTINDGFRIVPGVMRCPVVTVSGPSAMRNNTQAVYAIQVSNPSNTDQKNIVVNIATTHDSLWVLNMAGNTVYASPTDSFNGAPLPGGRSVMLLIPVIPANGTVSLIAEGITTSMPASPRQVIAGVTCPVFMDQADIEDCIRLLLADIYQALPADPGCIQRYTDSAIVGLQPQNYGRHLWHATQKCMPGVNISYEAFLRDLIILQNSDYTHQPCAVVLTPQEISTIETEVLWSYDPNDKSGPSGFATGRFIHKNDRQFHYLINFENEPSAAAAAQIVRVEDTLDKDVFDLSTFRLVAVKAADTLILLPGDLSSYTGYIDFRPKGLDYLLKLDASLDTNTGVATWIFTTVDPGTMELTMDPYAGFLPPNKVSPEGQGSIFFDIRLKDNIPANKAIRNKAYIYFDTNPPIITNDWSNQIDTIAPQSHVEPLPPYSTDTTIQISWSGSDLESGVSHYSVFVSTNGGAYYEWKRQTTETSGWFTGRFDSTYSFYSIATDSVGNIETGPAAYDTRTLIIDCRKQKQPSLDTLGQTTICYGDTVTLRIIGGASYLWNTHLTTSSINITSSGKYSAIVTDSLSCKWFTDTTEITVHPLPHAPVITRHGDTLRSSYPTSNQWYKDHTALPGATGQSYLPLGSGMYTVSYSDSHHCTSMSGVHAFFPLTIGKITEKDFSATIHPNPSDGVFTINIENMTEDITLSVWSIQGQIIKRDIMVCADATCTYRLNISDLPSGVYMLLLQSGSQKTLHPIHKR